MKKTQQNKGRAQPDGTISTQELASMADLSGRRLRDLAGEGLIPGPVRGRWGAVAVLAALVKFYRAQAPTSATESLTGFRRDREKHRARREKVEADLAEASVIDVQAALRHFAKCAGAVKTRLMSIPAKCAPLLEGKSLVERQELLQGEIVSALTELQSNRLTQRAK